MAHGHDHHPALAHHFEDLDQQFEANKLGMWIFLATEVLLFAGLFCAYAVYRANHPEIFAEGAKYLDTTLGAINTVILITSSLTMAWGVRCAQLNQQKGLQICLALTILGGFGFMGIKYVEYKSKIEHGLLWAGSYTHGQDHGEEGADDHSLHTPDATETHLSATEEQAEGEEDATPPAGERPPIAPSKVGTAATGPQGLTPPPSPADEHAADAYDSEGPKPWLAEVFFSIYFCMTGLHGIHVLIGMLAIGWVLMRARRGDFDAQYFFPVDIVGLYWHIVDLIWIFLFPLLYLI